MARIRSVHPDICQSETMAYLDARLERTFVRLWTHCDDEGRCEDRPKIIKAAIYPEHDAQTPEVVDEELTLLAQDGLLIRYEADGKKYVQVRSWNEYQKPQKARPSKYPPPPGWLQDEDGSDTGERKEEYGPGEGEGDVEGEGDSNAPSVEPDIPFEDFWKSYPTRKGVKGSKKRAADAWKRLSRPKRAQAFASLDLYSRVSNGFPKDAERYLRDEMWEGIEEPKGGSNGHQPFKSATAAEYAGRIQ